MVKTFRKLAALTAAVALVSSFAVCASAAVTVNTTTSYINGSKIAVKAVVSDGDDNELNNAQVTYYATNPNATATDEIVYMDQKTASNGSATFEFKTNADYIESTVKVSYTNATGPVTDKIPDYTCLIVKDGNGTEKGRAPIKADVAGPYTVDYTLADGYYVSALTVEGVEGAEAIITTQEGNKLTFYLLGLGSVDKDITIKATETQHVAGDEIGKVVSVGGIIAGDNSNDDVEYGEDADGYKAEAGDRKLTVIGQVTGLAADADFGVIVTTQEIDENAQGLPTAGFYAAKAKNIDGYFAVQLIDTNKDAENATFIKPNTIYHTAVYYKAGAVYKIIKGNDVTINSPAQ